MWSELLEREIFSEDENGKKPKPFSDKGFPAPPFGLFLNCWFFPAPKTFELLVGEGDHCSRSTGGVTGVLCMSLYYQSLGLQKISDLRLKSKPSWRGSVLHIVMSRFHSLKPGAGPKPLGSSMALWEARVQPLHHADNHFRKDEDCFASAFSWWAGTPQLRLRVSYCHLKIGTYSGAYKTCQNEKLPPWFPKMRTELRQHWVLGLVAFSATGQKIILLLLEQNLA